MTVIINEWLPDPEGADAEGEFIELFNNGQAVEPLAGWSIKDKSGKQFNLTGKTIEAGEFLVLPYKETKITLNNKDEEVTLLREGQVVDKTVFSGPAVSGQSFSRGGEFFSFTEPTPGAANKVVEAGTGVVVGDEAIAAGTAMPMILTAVAVGLVFGAMAGYGYKLITNHEP